MCLSLSSHQPWADPGPRGARAGEKVMEEPRRHLGASCCEVAGLRELVKGCRAWQRCFLSCAAQNVVCSVCFGSTTCGEGGGLPAAAAAASSLVLKHPVWLPLYLLGVCWDLGAIPSPGGEHRGCIRAADPSVKW